MTNYQSPINNQDEVNLFDYWKVILRHKKMIIAIVLSASVVAVISSLLMTNTYKAYALIMPVSAKGGGGGLSALASQFGSLASLAGVNLSGGGAGEADKFMAVLRSRTLAENVINRESLMPILFKEAWDMKKGDWKSDDPKQQPKMEDAASVLRGLVVAVEDKKNKTITITGEFENPELAARIVNVYMDELQKFINSNAFTMAKRNRLFIEGQLEQNKSDLLEAGKEINNFYKSNRISSAEAKLDVPISTDTLHGTGNEPDESQKATSADIESLLSQKADVERKILDAKVVQNVPQQVYLTYMMMRRELLAKVNALLTTQYEMAKIEEAKEDLAFQVIDKAFPPGRKFRPKRAQICIMTFMVSLFGAVFLAFFRDYLVRMRAASALRS